MKNCPFCKKNINDNDSRCIHCERTLIERIEPVYTQQKTNKQTKSPNDILKKLIQKIKNFNLNNLNVYIPIIALVILIIFISTQGIESNVKTDTSSIPVSVIPSNNEIPDKDPKTYISLPNGTVLSINSYYFNGLGQLEINNGTKMDAVIKLVNTATDKSVYTAYIRSNSILKLKKITDGNYKLYFNLGNNWDSQLKAFSINSSYEVFEEVLDFTTQEYEEGDYIRTRYSIFKMTLNPVVGGNAKTDNINPIEFGNY